MAIAFRDLLILLQNSGFDINPMELRQHIRRHPVNQRITEDSVRPLLLQKNSNPETITGILDELCKKGILERRTKPSPKM
ncbi:MAG: hypothetical protein KW802_02975 [Candidatus Doudnabacteria bacterium]|nr:hypothetical protein [Candidatus Doudnabacteria bacterium]